MFQAFCPVFTPGWPQRNFLPAQDCPPKNAGAPKDKNANCWNINLKKMLSAFKHLRASKFVTPTTLAVKTYKVVLDPIRQSDKVSAFHAQFYHWDVGICMFIMWGLCELRNRQCELRNRQPSQTKHARCLQPLSSVWEGLSISCSVLSLRRWYLYVHHVRASAHWKINKPSQTRHAKCLQPLSSVWQGVSISCSVLSLRRWYLYVHHVRAL